MSQLDLHKITIGRPKEGPYIVDILDLSRHIEVDPELIDSLIDLLFISFESDDIGIDFPSRIYLLADGKEVVAAVFLTPVKTFLPPKYHSIMNGYYIYNVCTAVPYRGRGLMKQMLSQILLEDPDFPELVGDERSVYYPSPVFYLKVLRSNLPAYGLYLRLGFRKVESNGEEEDILEWTRPDFQ